jgi:AAA domain, putative AbiEii toxin, Type IV TA system
MRVTSLRIQNFRSFIDSGPINLSDINVLIGSNNAGKSTILRGLHQLQHGLSDPLADVRVGATQAQIEIGLINGQNAQDWPTKGNTEPFTITCNINSPDRRGGGFDFNIRIGGKNHNGDRRLQPIEPHHFVVPYFSKRKTNGYTEDIREQNVLHISSDVSSLAAKLSRLGNPAFPRHATYSQACQAILGFIVTAIPSPNGQRPGVYLPDGQTLPIDQLGEGVPNIVQFLVSLATSEGKLFLVEEPENDLHPQALKALLDLVIESASRNQFVISTHSNIVVRHLCSIQSSKLYQVRPRETGLPVESDISEVPNTADARLAVLSDLGYSLSDFELWDGWLVLEESSAERLIRDFLIPWFVPTLSRLRTISAGGASKVSATFEDLNRLFLFTHLTPAYRETSWVVVDGDDVGLEVLARLRSKFPDDRHSRFRSLSKHAFEHYYPNAFSDRVTTALSITDQSQRREAKRQLLLDVIVWLREDEERGRTALRDSAVDVINLLSEISTSLPWNRQ